MLLELLFLHAFLSAAVPAPAATAAPQPLEVSFEVKLLVRHRTRGFDLQLDQWSGGRMRMEGTRRADGATVYRISEILESPWTFRWYPTRDEVKLGAAIWVEHPAGHPYGSLAPLLEPWARSKFSTWWDRDAAAPGPPWSAESGRFWKRRHRAELQEKDPLPAHPTYPFHVLGPIDDRFGFTLRVSGIEDIVERMSGPWLSDGWSEALAGETVEGYGYWERDRPRWEPRTYEAFAAALELLADSVDPIEGLMRVVIALQPRSAKLVGDWRAGGRVGDRNSQGPGWTETENGTIRGAGEGTGYRLWRRRDAGSDEVQVLVRDGGADAFKAWVRVGYRAVPRRTP